jgi:hypothetical protein
VHIIVFLHSLYYAEFYLLSRILLFFFFVHYYFTSFYSSIFAIINTTIINIILTSICPSFPSPLRRFRNHQHLSPTSPSFSSSSSSSRSLCIGHYSSGLEGVSRADRLELRGAFDSLYAYLAEELSSSSAGTHHIIRSIV